MDRPVRIRVFAAVVLLAAAVLALQGVTADPGAGVVRGTADKYPGDTLITVQSYGSFHVNNGQAFIVTPAGEIVWAYDPPNSRVFDGEFLPTGNILLSVATAIPSHQCPTEYRATDRYPAHCVKNRVIEIDPESNTTVWAYAWHDAFTHWHEVHDADRLPSGETAIADMGNDRAFIVNPAGEIVWEWRAVDHITPGTEFWNRYVPSTRESTLQREGDLADWTHLNDIDVLENGNVQLSVRNFDVILEIDRDTNAIVDVIGRPGNHRFMYEQHDPHRLSNGTILIADSKNNRIVERDIATGQRLWTYTGGFDRLQWPRNADRLPNGNTLIADSRNARVIEINATGTVVWEYTLESDTGIVYDADRLGVAEDPADAPSGRQLEPTDHGGVLIGTVRYIESWAPFVFPPWVRGLELAALVVGTIALLGLTIDLGRARLRRHRG